ncbi:MAG: hypothetical protein JO271_04015 [Verrucomicrobia bacterium]|nr:hypothetical protein [Verrucomicrobiota bacterium]MBV9272459.1 hypothetical protein [Verrucomicrobiota bacterium]
MNVAGRRLSIRQRFLLGIACQLWIWVNFLSHRSAVETSVVSVIQLIAVVLLFLRLKRTRDGKEFYGRGIVLLITLIITLVNLGTVFLAISGRAIPIWLSSLGAVELVFALGAVLYTFLQRPTRILLILYTVSFVAAIQAGTLTSTLVATLSRTANGSDYAALLGIQKIITLFAAAGSMIYPILFLIRGQYSKVRGEK